MGMEGWFGVGVGEEGAGAGVVGSIWSSIGINSSETEGVGEVMCANVPDERMGVSKD